MKTAIVTSARIFMEDNKKYIDNGVNIVLKRYQKYFCDITVFGMDGSDKGLRPSTVSLLETSATILGSRNDLLLGKEKQILERELPEFDLIILRVPSNTCNRAAKIARKHNIPYFVEVIGDAFGALWYHSLKAKPFAIGLYFRTRETIYNADFALYVSQKFLQSKYPCKNYSVGVSDCSFDMPTDDVVRNRLSYVRNKDYSKITLMNAAAIDVKYKGQEYIIKAIPLLNKEGIKVRCLLVGNGNNLYLKSIARKNGVLDQVIFVGGVPHQRVIELLDESDFYIQPSLTEAFGRSVVEALSRGCICIGSRVGGITELIDDDYLVQPKKYTEIADRILRYICLDLNKKEEVTKKNFDHASYYSQEELDKRRNEYYRYLLETMRRG